MNNKEKLIKHAESQNKWRLNNPDKVKAIQARYRNKNAIYLRDLNKNKESTPEMKAYKRAYRKKNYEKYKEKHDARIHVNNALRSGAIIRSKYCEGCFIEDSVQGHHYDYSKPQNVIWLCRKCHQILRNIEYRESKLKEKE